MGLTTTVVPEVRFLRLEGELDLATVDALEAMLEEPLTAGGPIMLEMSGVTFVDSSGIAAFIRVAKRLGWKGWCLYLHVDGGLPKKVLDLVGLAKVPNIHISDHQEVRVEHVREPSHP
jgi:anti-sigma B factor antagonist